MNKFLVDSDVFVNSVLKTEKQEVCVKFLDGKEAPICTTILNLMELSSVLSRKYDWNKSEIHEVVDTIEKGMDVVIPSEAEILEGYELVMKDFFTTVDAILLSISKNQNLRLVTFDGELMTRGSEVTEVISPVKLIEE
ncbi:MAG: type II toxin-antitoxin system VapC family toxin [Thermoplasmata archaeon]